MYGNLKVFRESLGMTQKEFAASLSIGLTTYNGYETGARDPKSDFWIVVAKKYGVTIDYLMGYSPEPDKTSEDIKKSPPEPGEDSAREEQLRLERSWAQSQEVQLPKGTAFYNAMMAQSNMADPDILRMETGCLALLDQIVRKARFGDQYDKDTLDCVSALLCICSKGLDHSQKTPGSFFTQVREFLLDTAKAIDSLSQNYQAPELYKLHVLAIYHLLISSSIYTFSKKNCDFTEIVDPLEELLDSCGMGPCAMAEEKAADEFAALAKEQYLSEQERGKQASSANKSGAG